MQTNWIGSAEDIIFQKNHLNFHFANTDKPSESNPSSSFLRKNFKGFSILFFFKKRGRDCAHFENFQDEPTLVKVLILAKLP